MTLRTLILAASALALTAGMAASTSAEAASRHGRAHAGRHMTHKPMSAAAMRRSRSMARGPMRGRDGESASVDQLNAQSLAAARGGAPAAVAQ